MNNINTIINLDFIKSLKPCTDRLENYIDHYEKESFSVEQFIGLDKITWEDKFWVLWNRHFLTVKQKIELAPYFAEHVLHLFEKRFPDDTRPRAAIEAAKNGTVTEEIIKAAGEAAEAAREDGAAEAAWEAVWAVWADRAAWAAAWEDGAAGAAAWETWAARGQAWELERQYQVELIFKKIVGE